MRLSTVFLLVLVWVGSAGANPGEGIFTLLRGSSAGRMAQCREGELLELNVISEIKALSSGEIAALTDVLADAASYRTDVVSGCIPKWDFKIVLLDRKREQAMEIFLCTSCRQIGFKKAGESEWLSGGLLKQTALDQLVGYFDKWFPEWRSVRDKQPVGRKWLYEEINK